MVEACVTAVISQLMWIQQNVTHEFSHVGCSRLWARSSQRLQTLCHISTQVVVQLDYLLLVGGIYPGTHRWLTFWTVILLEKNFHLSTSTYIYIYIYIYIYKYCCCGLTRPIAISKYRIPRLTSDSANEFFTNEDFFAVFWTRLTNIFSANECFSGCAR